MDLEVGVNPVGEAGEAFEADEIVVAAPATEESEPDDIQRMTLFTARAYSV